MSQESLNTIFLVSPLIIGGIVATMNENNVNDLTEKVEGWVRARQLISSSSNNWFPKFIVNPMLWVIVKFSDWTDDFTHRGLKNGVRIAATLYFIAIWIYLLFSLFMLLFFLAIGILIIYVILKIIINSNPDFKRGFNASQNLFNQNKKNDVTNYAGFKGGNLYSGTNWLNEELRGRVDEKGNIYKGTNWFNEDKIGRIDENGNIFSGTNFFNEEKVGRIDEDGNIIKGTNWFNEEKTGRIDADGNIIKGTNWFNEEKTGRTGN